MLCTDRGMVAFAFESSQNRVQPCCALLPHLCPRVACVSAIPLLSSWALDALILCKAGSVAVVLLLYGQLKEFYLKQGYRIETGQDPQHVIQLLENELYKFNSSKIDRHDGRLFSRVVRDQNGSIIAGIAGWTWAGACEITQLWVSQSARNEGVGKGLLEAAEEEATGAKCNTILVRTYSFQAPSFYEKYGYRIEQVVENFPSGHRYYTLTKRLR